MDSKLDRYLTQQDAEYGLDPVGIGGTPQDEKTYLTREIQHIERFLEGDTTRSLVPPHEWYDRLTECKSRLRALLAQEMTLLQSTSQLHCEGLIKIHLRQLELESQLRELEVAQ